MEKKEFIYMMEKMNEVRLFSRSLIIHSTIKNKRTAQEYDLLSQLVLHNEGMTPANLSKAMYLNKTIVSRLVDKLNKDGYVTKKQDEYDKRSYSVFITEYGKEELGGLWPAPRSAQAGGDKKAPGRKARSGERLCTWEQVPYGPFTSRYAVGAPGGMLLQGVGVSPDSEAGFCPSPPEGC